MVGMRSSHPFTICTFLCYFANVDDQVPSFFLICLLNFVVVLCSSSRWWVHVTYFHRCMYFLGFPLLLVVWLVSNLIFINLWPCRISILLIVYLWFLGFYYNNFLHVFHVLFPICRCSTVSLVLSLVSRLVSVFFPNLWPSEADIPFAFLFVILGFYSNYFSPCIPWVVFDRLM